MKFSIKVILLVATLFVAACSESNRSDQQAVVALEVFKTPTCSCCGRWVTHLKKSGLQVNVTNYDSLTAIKNQLGIPSNLQSCHTGVSHQGYYFEGHIPAKFVAQFLANPPEHAAGLAVPGMPTGSPGMEMGNRFDAYQIILVNKDGSSEVYAQINSMEEQQ